MEVTAEQSGDRSSAILVYTDGACFPNPGRGGWGARIVYSDGTRDERQGSASGWTTSSRMEMTAVLMGLRAVTEANRPVIVRSDSQFVIRTLCGRYRRHKNFDLWKDIDREVARFRRIRFEWVRGHAGDVHNEAADKLANAGAAQAPHPSGAPPAPTTPTELRKGKWTPERSRSRLRCSRCNSPVRRRRRFPGELRCRCGFTRGPELQNGESATAVGKKTKGTIEKGRAEYQERSRRRAVEKIRRLTTQPVTVPSMPSAASSDALTQQHREHHRGEFPERCARCRREVGSTER
jgi:ribonuclease HI